MKDTLPARKERARKIVAKLKELFPKAKIGLNFSNPFELLVAVVLSAQSTDKKVNEVTSKLFKKYQGLDAYLKANLKEFEKDISSINYYKTKAKNILKTAKVLKENFGGKIPKTVSELTKLPGVGRKTALIVQSNLYGILEGIAVDTHVKRLSQKLGLTNNSEPEKIEKDLMQILPRKEWFDFTYRMIEYGRKYCPAKKHNCQKCPLTKIYPKASDIWPKS